MTLYDVAQRAGVSIATVSRVLHGHEMVREATRSRVLAVIEELGYVPDGAAQSLARSRKDVIGLVCMEHSGFSRAQHDSESMSMLFYDGVLRGVEARLRTGTWSLLLTFLSEAEVRASSPDDSPVRSRLRTLSGKVDGLLISEGVVPPLVMSQLARRLPVVAVAGDPAQQDVDVVTADNWSGVQAIVTHLVTEHGARRIFHVDGPESAPDATVRRDAMRAVIDVYPGVQVVGRHIGRFSVHSGEEAAGRLLADAKAGYGLPDAVVCANDQMAIGVLAGLAAGGVRVPGDVAVVGFDDIFPASMCDPPLTTVHQPIRRLGEVACDRLIARITAPGQARQVDLLPTELVLRSSCGCPPGTSERHVAESRSPPAPQPA